MEKTNNRRGMMTRHVPVQFGPSEPRPGIEAFFPHISERHRKELLRKLFEIYFKQPKPRPTFERFCNSL